jgi:hypothetical protein
MPVLYPVDRMSTISVLSSAISQCVVASAVATAALYSVRAWFSPAVPESERMANLKRDRVGAWWLCGCFYVLCQMAITMWCSDEYLGIIAQYLDGPVETRRGIVVSVRKGDGREGCRRSLKMRDNDDGQLLGICLKVMWRASLAKEALAVGEAVTLRVRETSLGRVAVFR